MIMVTVQEVDSDGHVQLTNIYTIEPKSCSDERARRIVEEYVRMVAQCI